MQERVAAAQELAHRLRWTLAALGQLLNEAREMGWTEGAPLVDVEDPAALRAMPDELDTITTPMQRLARALRLSATEMDALWLLACVEIEPALSCAARHLLPPGMFELSAQIVERLVSIDGVLDEDVLARLQSYALVEMSEDPRVPLHRRAVRAHERVLDLVRGRVSLDRSLRDLATLRNAIDIRRETAPFEVEVPSELQKTLRDSSRVLVVATGCAGSGRGTLLRHAVSSSGRAVLAVRASELAVDETSFLRQLRVIGRECRLHDAVPLLLDVDGIQGRAALIERELLATVDGPVFATSREPCTWPIARATLSIPVSIPDRGAREAIWRRALPAATPQTIRACASKYTIAPGVITRSADAATTLVAEPSLVEPEHVHRALRVHLERQLAGLARRIETRQSWDDLVLPVDQFDLLVELVARVRHRERVLEEWGFADKVGRGLGVSALLSGPPGTGKTMIAGLSARELGLDLYQVDLSKVVSKYIGETEKQLAGLFEAAESGHAIILFDEADSLFAKRTQVKSSNDRYANLEVNYLLQRIEAFSGITLLTTNHETAIDPAFMRLLAFHVRVPMPDEQYRAMLWQSMLPARAACADGLEFDSLAAEFQMTGGYIKNAVLRAAFLAADQDTPINNDHLRRAARAEYEAMGKVSYQPAAIR